MPNRYDPHPAAFGRAACAALALMLAAACSPKPSPDSPKLEPAYAESIHRVCNVDELAGLDADENPINVEADRHDWMMSNVKHPDIIELITLMRVESNAKRAQMLRSAVDGTGATACPLADYYEANADE
jgi:hypothetical protein